MSRATSGRPFITRGSSSQVLVQDLSFGGFKATLLGAPTLANDAAVFGATPDYIRKQRGLVAQNYPPEHSTNSNVAVSQSLYQLKVWLPYSVTVTGIVVAVVAAGVTLTANQNIATLYAQDGTKLGDTADQSGVWNAIGTYAMALGGGPFSVTGGDGRYCWVTLLSNGTTPASFSTSSNRQAFNASSGGPLSGANLMCGRNGTGITASPSPLVPANAVITASFSYWVGLY